MGKAHEIPSLLLQGETAVRGTRENGTLEGFGLQRHGRDVGDGDDGYGVGIPRNGGRPWVGLGWPVWSCSDPYLLFPVPE